MGKHKHILTILSLSALVFVLFGGTMRHGFNSDDYLVIYHALRDSTGSVTQALAAFARPSWGLYYRPVITFFFELLAKSFGMWTGGYHLVSLVCYAALCVEVYLIALLLTDRWRAATASAVIFMTLGAHGEAIFWVSSLNGIVENVLALASLILFIAWRRGNKRTLYFLSLLIFILALLTKESAISLPIILVLYDFLLGGEVRWAQAAKRAAKSCWPFVAAGFAFILLRAAVMRQIHLPPPLVTFEWRMLLAGPWHALVMTLSPVDWSRALAWFDNITRTQTALYLLIAAVLTTLALAPLLFRRYRVAFLALWIMAAPAPLFALGLAPAERHIVFASVGSAILVAIVLFKLAEWMTRSARPFSVVMGFVLVAAFAAPGYGVLKQSQRQWKSASLVAGGVIEQTLAAYPSLKRHSTLFFLNVPDSVGDGFVFRFGNIEHALWLTYGDDTLEAVRIVTLDRVSPQRLAWPEAAYFDIAAMGGHVYLPPPYAEVPERQPRWQALERLGILEKNSRYIGDWERYGASPFLVYANGALTAMPPSELKKVVEGLYSLR